MRKAWKRWARFAGKVLANAAARELLEWIISG